jgi:two-component system phosphate regulon response regulator PhoB
VLAFESGVDDFVAKPFYPPELGARVSAVLRGFADRGVPAAAIPQDGAIRIEPASDRVIVDGRRIDLTPRELTLLRALLDQAGRVVRRGQLIDRLWGGRAPHERAIDAHVKTIRRKLGSARGYLETVRGVGYRISETAIASSETAPPAENRRARG